jgi:hypothetical protein
MVRILITGSRTWDDEALIWASMRRVIEAYPLGEQVTVVHGDAPGADSIAARCAIRDGHIVEAHPADWDRYSKRAGFIRNAEMVKLGADICLAFIHNNSKGATMTADLAIKAGIPTRRFIRNA